MCITVVGTVMEVADGRAVVLVNERSYAADASLHPTVRPGEHVVIQAGLIMDVISADEARELEAVQRELEALLAAAPEP
jgi:hydrogenase maturation factor